ncbi:MAG: hypothetical protein QME21_00880 [Anaerolineales bacterium]|nr:hypothetical protein [Anaerolineales bacterium]
MKVIDLANPEGEERKSSGLSRAIGNLIPASSRADRKSQEAVLQIFKNILDNRFVMLLGLKFPSAQAYSPLILVGPPGVWVILASPMRGVFRAVEDQWEEMDARAHSFKPARANLPLQAVAMSKTVEALLTELVMDAVPIEPAVLFTNPGAHIEPQRPIARLIQADAIGRFAANLLQTRVTLSREAIESILERLSQPLSELALAKLVQAPGLDEAPDEAKAMTERRFAAPPLAEPKIIQRVSRFAAFNRRQWLILGALLVGNIILFAAIIIIILIIT